MSALRVARHAAGVGFADVKAQYSWRSWLFGWFVRATAQVLFFTAIGLVVGGNDLVMFAFVGNVAASAALLPLSTAPDTAWERSLGTLPLLVAAPGSILPVFAGRSAFHVVRAFGESVLIFAVLAPLLGFSGHWWWLPVGVLSVSLGAYGLGLFLAAVAIRRLRTANILLNLTFYTLVAIGGVNVPSRVFPEVVERVADVLPLHHGLLGLRHLLADGLTADGAVQLGLELAVGAAWFALALAGFALFAEGGRRDGTIDLAE